MEIVHISPQVSPRMARLVPYSGFFSDFDHLPGHVASVIEVLIGQIRENPFSPELTVPYQVRPFKRPWKFRWHENGHEFSWELHDRPAEEFDLAYIVKCH